MTNWITAYYLCCGMRNLVGIEPGMYGAWAARYRAKYIVLNTIQVEKEPVFVQGDRLIKQDKMGLNLVVKYDKNHLLPYVLINVSLYGVP